MQLNRLYENSEESVRQDRLVYDRERRKAWLAHSVRVKAHKLVMDIEIEFLGYGICMIEQLIGIVASYRQGINIILKADIVDLEICVG